MLLVWVAANMDIVKQSGAGQEVGKSCAVVTINGKKIMFDCGMHMGYVDHRRYPDFSRISKSGDFDNAISCVIITHFHLDHIGALPYFTEVCGYTGPHLHDGK
ncbi:putative metallo-beta-lactamase, ribonuclease Z/Hydroxyacylglutathione hydrolase [Helianthus debilis subsp. tardiflorus]